MKTILTALFVAAVACIGTGFGQEKPASETPPVKADEKKKITIDDVKAMLIPMGYDPTPYLNKDGKLTGYNIKFSADGFDFYCRLMLSNDGVNLWLDGSFGKDIDETAPSAALLKMLDLNDKIWPAYVIYVPNWKSFQVNVSTPAADLTPVKLRQSVNDYMTSMKTVLTTWNKAIAEDKEKKNAKEKASK